MSTIYYVTVEGPRGTEKAGPGAPHGFTPKPRWCCELMEQWVNSNQPVHWTYGAATYQVPLSPLTVAPVTYASVQFCPFCGEKVTYKEARRLRYVPRERPEIVYDIADPETGQILQTHEERWSR